MEHETFWSLLRDPAHWYFELFLILIFDILIGALIWPRLRKSFTHHKEDDERIDELEKRIKQLEDSQR